MSKVQTVTTTIAPANSRKAKPQVKKEKGPFDGLEKELDSIAETCRSVLNDENVSIKPDGSSTSTYHPSHRNESIITLTKVAKDMNSLLEDLKDNLVMFKRESDSLHSLSDVEPELEKLIKKQSKSKGSGGKSARNKTSSSNTKSTVAKNKDGDSTDKAQKKNSATTGNSQNRTGRTTVRSRNTNAYNNSPTKNDRNERGRSPTKNEKIEKDDRSKSTTRNISDEDQPLNDNNRAIVNRSVYSSPPNEVVSRIPNSSNAGAGFLGRTRSLRTLFLTNDDGATRSRSASVPRSLFSRESYNPLGSIKDEVKKAIAERKTFTVKGGFPAVRRALLKRGWIEKIHPSYRDKLSEELRRFQNHSIMELVRLLRNKDLSDICRRLIKSKLLGNHQVDVYWSNNYEPFKECSDRVKCTKINKIRRSDLAYTSKQGLCQAAKRSHWCVIPGLAQLNHPRSYCLIKNGDTEVFINDFNITAAISLLQWVKYNSETKQCKIISPAGRIPINVFDFAVTECYKFIKRSKHEDIDVEIQDALSQEWNEFLNYYYKTVHIGNHFKQVSYYNETDIVKKCIYILENLKPHWPYLDMDGMMNLWILKPTNSSQGVGIHMCRTLKYILDVVKNNPNRRYVVQKYIERPLLIHNTKFDIRQWFLISSASPLTIWCYKQCYLRFSSQTFNLRKLHESIHLTNNSVQAKYMKQTTKDIALPSYNMWDSKQFENFLSDIGFPNAFNQIVYPGMKQCIIASILLHHDKIEPRHDSFELYGADFMVTEDFKPWLLEINSSPALYASTPITARMCPVLLDDVIKVIVDHERNKSAGTGDFELIYQAQATKPVKKDNNFQVHTVPLSKDYFHTPSITSKMTQDLNHKGNRSTNEAGTTKSGTGRNTKDPQLYIKNISSAMKDMSLMIAKLIKEKKKRREFPKKNRSVETLHVTGSRETQTIAEINMDRCYMSSTTEMVLKNIDLAKSDKWTSAVQKSKVKTKTK